MALADIHWTSGVLQKCVGMYVLLPEVGKGPYPVMYLLHGLSDDYTMWHRRSRIEWYARNYPMIVVMPDGYRGFYTDNVEGPAYGKYMAEELPAFVEKTFHARTKGKARCIAGLSMGGYGALRLALGNPGRYVSAVSHSGAVILGATLISKLAEGARVFGKNPTGTDHDLVALARKAKAVGKLPKLRFDCGLDDGLLAANRELHRKLQALRVPHEYEEFPGDHGWDYWDLHIQETLAFHARAMGI